MVHRPIVRKDPLEMLCLQEIEREPSYCKGHHHKNRTQGFQLALLLPLCHGL